jgi:hypothetical protein
MTRVVPVLRIAFAVGFCISCTPACENQVLQKVMAPDQGKVAVLFQRECGATTGFNWQVSIMRPRETPGEIGNAFVGDLGNSGTAIPNSPIRLQWRSPDELIILHDRHLRIFKRASHVSGITISLQALP